MKMKKLSTIALAAAMAIGTFGFSVPAKAAENSTDYTITIPATLSVESAGWNATDGITAKVKSGDTFDSSKKLTVTAASANEWNLKSGENAIAYKMASNTEQEKSYADATATTSLEISAEELNTGNYEAPFGIVVEDYSNKPAGEYKDTVTFTASVVSATKKLKLTGSYFDCNAGDFVNKSLEIEYTDNDTWKDIAGRYNEVSLEDNSFGPEGKIVKLFVDENHGISGCELKSNESVYRYNLVSINDKVSAYSSYFLGH
jgi:hypothetical protein